MARKPRKKKAKTKTTAHKRKKRKAPKRKKRKMSGPAVAKAAREYKAAKSNYHPKGRRLRGLREGRWV